jgi:hypothetical protein
MISIAVIIVISIYLLWSFRTAETQLMKGFWRADAAFCESAELSMFVLYLGDNKSWIGNSRYGYLLAANAQGIIINNPMQITFSGSYCVEPYMSKFRNYNVHVDWLEEAVDDDIFPAKFNAAYYAKNGKLVLYADGKVLATLWKDQQMSALGCGEMCPKEVIDEDN